METNRREIERRLEREGWYLVRHGGNHDIYEHPYFQARIQLPRHNTFTNGVARRIAKTAGWM